jgi:hypothetical protein
MYGQSGLKVGDAKLREQIDCAFIVFKSKQLNSLGIFGHQGHLFIIMKPSNGREVDAARIQLTVASNLSLPPAVAGG